MTSWDIFAWAALRERYQQRWQFTRRHGAFVGETIPGVWPAIICVAWSVEALEAKLARYEDAQEWRGIL